MKKLGFITVLALLVACSRQLISSNTSTYPPGLRTLEDSLYFIYSQPSKYWPKPNVDISVNWIELGPLPSPPLDSSPHREGKIALGKTLFFDSRLSGSARLSCASCHLPELSWTDGRQKSLGHDDQPTKRNSPSLLNVWFYTSFFWDGRSSSLEDQAFSPINSAREMHSNMSDVVRALRKINDYQQLFKKAFGTATISPETITEAIAAFERTLVSSPAAFDRFLAGDKQSLTTSAIRGLHLFRTKAGCMNCHHGPLFTDNQSHNTGLANVGGAHEDLGRYAFTHKDEDAGKFKTQSLRDVVRTGPWMHHGIYDNLYEVVVSYSTGRVLTPPHKPNPLFQQTSQLVKPLSLSSAEVADVVSFLQAISAPPPVVEKPVLPKTN